MSTIPAGYQVDWYRVPLPADTLRQLNERSDVRGLLQAGGHLLLLCATGGGAVWAALGHHWWWLAGLLYLHGTVCAFMINAVHELVHGTVFRTRWLNTLFVHVFAFIGWINHRGFWASHTEHHAFTMHFPYDQENVAPIDYKLSDFLRGAVFNPLALRWIIQGNWRTATGHIDGPWGKHLFEGQERRFAVFAWSRWLLIGHAAIAIVSLSFGLWIIPVVVSLTPLYGGALLWLLNNTQHVGMQQNARDFRLNCRSIEVNPVFRFLYWHMNWHIEHHMYAAVPCYRLGALNRAIRHALPPAPRGLVATWFHIIGVIFRQRSEPGWEFQPALPDAAPAPAAAVRSAPAASAAPGAREQRKVWQCSICGFIYDELLGLPAEGIAPGTAWADIPADWRCPDCRVSKSDFAMVEISRPVVAATTSSEPVVIVGSGMAAYAVARELRQLGSTQPVIVVTRDDGAVYAKPALSNALAHGRSADGLVTRSASEIAVDLRIAVRAATTVSAIDRGARTLATSTGTLRYRHLVLALGADQIRIPLSGDAVSRVLSVNDLADYRIFRQRLPAGGTVAIIGGGLIGCEFANDLCASGHRVAIIEQAAHPLASLLPAEVGGALRRALADAGVAWYLGTSAARVDAAGERLRVTCADGRAIDADLVLSAVGLRPRLALAQAAGLSVGRGIRVDAHLTTSDPAISALGDCAEIDGQVLPYVLPLTHSARALAATLAGAPTAVAFPVMPIAVKTPAYPLLIVRPPAPNLTWHIESIPGGQIARASDGDGVVRGLILGGTAMARREELQGEVGKSLANIGG